MLPPTDLSKFAPEACWDAIERLLQEVLPTAEDEGVRLACHPQDPPLPPEGWNGMHHVVGSVEGLREFVTRVPSRSNALNFCQGTVAEMCEDPAREVIEAIEWFGARDDIVMVHFRNIAGAYLDFTEVYPDNGVVDMAEAIRAYHRVGFDGMLCPDHVPDSDQDPSKERQFAFAVGYTTGLLHGTASESKRVDAM
jgi:mannonate dehydratase